MRRGCCFWFDCEALVTVPSVVTEFSVINRVRRQQAIFCQVDRLLWAQNAIGHQTGVTANLIWADNMGAASNGYAGCYVVLNRLQINMLSDKQAQLIKDEALCYSHTIIRNILYIQISLSP